MNQLMLERDYLGNCRSFYERTFAEKFGRPSGIDVAKIAEFEKLHGITLPPAYKQFLLWMGGDTSGVFRGSDWFFKDLEENIGFLPDFLGENGVSIEKHRQPICFFSHQGYMAGWFYLLPHGDHDPVTYFYSESSDVNEPQSGGRFSEFLLKELKGAN